MLFRERHALAVVILHISLTFILDFYTWLAHDRKSQVEEDVDARKLRALWHSFQRKGKETERKIYAFHDVDREH